MYTAAEFWAMVDKSGGPSACWPWLGAFDKSGYGEVCYQGQRDRAHRLALRLALRRKLKKYALHDCDNPPCCNPAHLYEGTQKQNMEDMLARGRATCGEKHRATKLSDAEVSEIRQRRARGARCIDLATAFGISDSHISRIVRNLRRQAVC